MLVVVLSVVLFVSMAAAEVGHTGTDEDVWAYQWYDDEPFEMMCNSSKLNISLSENIVWETPNGMVLRNGMENDHFELKNVDNYKDMILYIKNLTPDLHGVYKCSVYHGDTYRTRMIIGLNVHEQKYRTSFDKYRDSLIVAIIATAVFIVPLGTTCFVYQYQYETPERKAKKLRRKQGISDYVVPEDNDYPMKSTDSIANSGIASNGKDGVENPTFDTHM